MSVASYFFLLLILLSTKSFAESIKLKCKVDGKPSDITINFDKKVMNRGVFEYKIHSITEKYIFGNSYNKNLNSMSSIILDRNNGDFIDATIGVLCWSNSDCKKDENWNLDSYTTKGKCSKKLF